MLFVMFITLQDIEIYRTMLVQINIYVLMMNFYILIFGFQLLCLLCMATSIFLLLLMILVALLG